MGWGENEVIGCITQMEGDALLRNMSAHKLIHLFCVFISYLQMIVVR